MENDPFVRQFVYQVGQSLMLKLHGHLPMLRSVAKAPYLVTVTSNSRLSNEMKEGRALLFNHGIPPQGNKALLIREGRPTLQEARITMCSSWIMTTIIWTKATSST
jgi:hypothetical protein